MSTEISRALCASATSCLNPYISVSTYTQSASTCLFLCQFRHQLSSFGGQRTQSLQVMPNFSFVTKVDSFTDRSKRVRISPISVRIESRSIVARARSSHDSAINFSRSAINLRASSTTQEFSLNMNPSFLQIAPSVLAARPFQL